MLKGIIFDFDGLLVDTEIVSLKMYDQLLHEYGSEMTEEIYARYYSGQTEENNVRKLIQDYDLPLSFDECMNRVLTLEKEIIAEGVELKPGVKELLELLYGVEFKIALATSSAKERALTILDQHGIRMYFDVTVFAEDIIRSKPDPEIFLTAAEKLGCKPEECLVFEDSENGIEAAYRAGMQVICIPDIKEPCQEFKKKVFKTYISLNELIHDIKGEDR